MPFHPKDKVKNTTRLPAALREELGLPAPSGSRFQHNRSRYGTREDDRNGADRPRVQRDKPQLKVIGKGTNVHWNPGKLRANGRASDRANSYEDTSAVASSSRLKLDPHAGSDHKKRKQEDAASPERNDKRARLSHAAVEEVSKRDQPAQPKRIRINPFTGVAEEVIAPSKSNTSSSHHKRSSRQTNTSTALERLLAKSEAKASGSSSKAKGKAVPATRKSRSKMTQAEKDEEDEIAWLEAHIGKPGDETRDDLDDFLDDLDRFQVGMFDPEGDAEQDDDDGSEDEESDEESESESGSEDDGTASSDGSLVSESEESDDVEAGPDGMELEALSQMDFDSNDELDYSNWDAAMATTDEEAAEGDSETEEDDDEDDEQEEIGEEGQGQKGEKQSGASDSQAPAAAAEPAPALPAPTAGRYIPPALRAKMAAEAAASAGVSGSEPSSAAAPEATLEQQKLRRQAKGLLNRLGDANIDSIVGEFEALYRSHSRAEVTAMITKLVLDTITARANLIDTYVILHAAFVAALHRVIGVEFAAFFVQKLVEDLLGHYEKLKLDDDQGTSTVDQDDGEGDEVKGKECLNLTVLACELYNLQVIACPLIYDLIRLFLGEEQPNVAATRGMVETDVELLLKVVRSSGQQLRHDDPTSLKAIISLTQERVLASTKAASGAASSRSTKLSSRSKFMLERLGDLKNNRSAKAGSNDPSDPSSPAGQLLTRMKKYLGGMGKKRTVRAYDALRISLKDLQDADTKGKWWLVGSAWAGQTDQKDAQGLTKLLPMNASAKSIQALASAQGSGGRSDADEDGSAASREEEQRRAHLLDLARKQGMNTEARRSVFVTIMLAEDYQDAAQKLLGLKLNDVQRREIIRVLLHCVGSEQTYNPYYTLILSSLLTTSHSMKITLQYCLWDFLREIGEREVGGHSVSSRLASGGELDADSDSDSAASSSGQRKLDPRRISNLSQTYAWLLSRSLLHLHCLKPVTFTALRTRGTAFLRLLFVHLVLASQANNPASTLVPPASSSTAKTGTASSSRYTGAKRLEHIVRASLVGNLDLSRGVLWFLRTKLGEQEQRRVVLGDETPFPSSSNGGRRRSSTASKSSANFNGQDALSKPLRALLQSLNVGIEVLAGLVEDAGKGRLAIQAGGADAPRTADAPAQSRLLDVDTSEDDNTDDEDEEEDEGGMTMTW